MVDQPLFGYGFVGLGTDARLTNVHLLDYPSTRNASAMK
jgi:hypothetical protein